MIGVLAILLALTGAEPPAIRPPAVAPPVPLAFAYFERYCLANPDDPAKALVSAGADGWMPVPRKMMPPPPAWVLESKFRIRSDASARYTMQAGRAAYPFRSETWDTAVCSIQIFPGDGEAIKAALERWVGWPGEAGEDGTLHYDFAEEGGRHRQVKADDLDIDRLFRSGAMRVVSLTIDPDSVSLLVASPRRPTDPVAPPKDERHSLLDAAPSAVAGG